MLIDRRGDRLWYEAKRNTLQQLNPLVLARLLLGVAGVGADLLVVALESREILTGLGELTLYRHTLATLLFL